MSKLLHYETKFAQNALPFWKTNVMYQECVTMHKRPDGSITAKMLCTPVRILEVRDQTLQKVYQEGKDYQWIEGTNTLKWLDGSEIPFFTENDLAGKEENGENILAWEDKEHGWDEQNPWDALGRSRFRDALFCVSPFYYEKQIAVTYEYPFGAYTGQVTQYQGNLLPKTLEKLQAGGNFKLTFYGDSIFVGCDSSSLSGREPKQELFPNLVKKALEERYPVEIEFTNPSKGGMDSKWGADNAEKLAAGNRPDLVVIGFGMNDGGKTGADVANYVQSIMDTIRKSNPDCEFIVVAPMVANAKSGFLITQGEFPAAFAKLCGEGVAFVNMFGVHSDILRVKDFASTSGNHVNHPNDWLIRVYAMNLIACLLDL